MTLTLATADLATGVRLPYAEQGDPDGVPLVLVHGWTDSWRSFEPVLPHLPPSIHAFALTLRGHGDAERPEDGYTVAELAADVVAFMDAIGVERAILLGHSLGGWIVQQLAIDHPERVLAAVLAGAFATPADNPAVPTLREVMLDPLPDPVDEASARAFQEGTTARPLAPGQLDVFVRESTKVPRRVWIAVYEGFAGLDLADSWPSIDAPTLLLWGDQDAMATRQDQDRLVGAIPDARLVVYEGAGHALHWEEPERFAAEVAAFAADLS